MATLPNSSSSLENVVAATLDVLAQSIQCLDRIPSNEIYMRECEVAGGGTVGKHMRHILDHFLRLLDGDESSKTQGSCQIDYDTRSGDVLC